MKLTILIITMTLAAAPVFGAVDKKEEGVLLDKLQNKVQKLTSKKKNSGPATVAGVKGAKTDRTDIYWKGKEKKLEINEDELQKFKLAIEHLGNGEKDQALKHLDAFIQEFPNSPLVAEAAQAVQQLRSGPLPAAATPLPTVIPSPSPVITVNPLQAIPAAAGIPAPKESPAPDKLQLNGNGLNPAK